MTQTDLYKSVDERKEEGSIKISTTELWPGWTEKGKQIVLNIS